MRAGMEPAASGYSCRSAIIGSTLVARRAGMRQATSATVASSSVKPANVTGSCAVTSKSKLAIKRVSANDATSPRATPQSASVIDDSPIDFCNPAGYNPIRLR